MTDILTAEMMRTLIDKYTHDLPPKFLFTPADEALKLSEWMNTVLGLLETALDFGHAPGCSGDLRRGGKLTGTDWLYPCDCDKRLFDEQVGAILGRKGERQ